MKNNYLSLSIAALILLSSCAGNKQDYLPQAPDYAAAENWFNVFRGGKADLFYICSTEVFDQTTEEGQEKHFASVHSEADREAMLAELNGVDLRLSGNSLNYFAPYYRQMSMESFTEQKTIDARVDIPASDIHAAFDYYWKHYNEGRPFVLAGFSQGALLAVDLLRHMPDSIYSHLAAAYVLGWHLTEEDLAFPAIVPASGATDTGVTICYNSVKTPEDANSIVSAGNCAAINPVNWCTDATPAAFGDSLTVHLDPATKLLLVDGYTRTDHAALPWFDGGNYHTFEIRWYTPYLRENIQERVQAKLAENNML